MTQGSLRRNVIANYLGQGWAAVMGLAFLPAYVHYLGIEAFGVIGLYAVLQAWLSVFDFGMSPTLNREMARHTAGAHDVQAVNDLLRSLEIVCFSIAVLLGAGVWIGADWLASDWLRSRDLAPAIIADALRIIAFVVALRFCEGIYRGALFGLQRQVWYNTAFAILSTLRWAGSVAVLALTPTIQAFFIWQALVSVASVTTLAFGLKARLPRPPMRPRFSLRAIKPVLRFAGGMTAISFLTLLLTQIDKVLVSRFASLADFGYYALAGSVALGLTFLVAPVSQAYFPRLTELASRGEASALVSAYHQSAQLVAVLVIPLALLLAFNAEEVVRVWSGDPQLAASVAPLLALLSIGTLFHCLMAMPYTLQLAEGWPGLTVRVNIVAACALIPALLWAVPRYGAMGAAWMWLALNAAYVLATIHLMHRRVLKAEKWRWYRSDVLAPLAVSLAIIWLGEWWPMHSLSRPSELLRLAAVGLLAFAAAAMIVPSTRSILLAGAGRVRSTLAKGSRA